MAVTWSAVGCAWLLVGDSGPRTPWRCRLSHLRSQMSSTSAPCPQPKPQSRARPWTAHLAELGGWEQLDGIGATCAGPDLGDWLCDVCRRDASVHFVEPRPGVRFWTCEVFDRLLINLAPAVASSREPQCHVRRDPPLVRAVALVSIALVLERHLSRSCICPDVMGRVFCFEAPSLPWEKYVDLSCPFLS